MTPARGTLLVRKVETEDTLPGGKVIIPESLRENLIPNQAEIVAVGLPELCDDEECERAHGITWRDGPQLRCHDHDLYSGNWIILKPRSLAATHEDGLYSVSQDAVLAVVRP